jgi:hypothetical protein
MLAAAHLNAERGQGDQEALRSIDRGVHRRETVATSATLTPAACPAPMSRATDGGNDEPEQ